MKTISYLTKLSLAARWLLFETEAKAVIEDYREILGELGEEEGEKKFGPPVRAILKIADWRSVIGWNLPFVLMAALTLLQAHQVRHSEFYPIISLVFNVLTGGILFFTLRCGAWRNPFSELKNSKPLLASVLIFLVFILGVPMFFGWLDTEMLEETLIFFSRHGFFPLELPRYVVFLSSVCALGFIALARVVNHRWRAAAILSLTLITECILILSVIGNMDPAAAVWDQSGNLLAVILLGILGAGAGLC